jgi:hypothetical protein
MTDWSPDAIAQSPRALPGVKDNVAFQRRQMIAARASCDPRPIDPLTVDLDGANAAVGEVGAAGIAVRVPDLDDFEIGLTQPVRELRSDHHLLREIALGQSLNG